MQTVYVWLMKVILRSKVPLRWWLNHLKFWKMEGEIVIDPSGATECKTVKRMRLFSLLERLIYRPKYKTVDEYRRSVPRT